MKMKLDFPGKKIVFTVGIVLLAVFNLSYLSASKATTTKTDTGVESLEPVNGEYTAELLPPPAVPKSVAQEGPQRVNVNIEVIEKPITLANGVKYDAWTFNGTIPGPMIKVHQGDLVHVNFTNDPTNTIAHNIDMHAVTGPGGGAVASMTAPGYTSSFEYRALNPGLYIYHCAAPPVGMHISNGMYGLIFVEPKGGLEPVDKEYYLVQSEFYTDGKHGEKGVQHFDMKKALKENPQYVVFDGSVGALTGTNAMTAEVGERIRLYVGNAGPSLTSSFHIIGVVMDNVHQEGGSIVNHNVQTTAIPVGGATVIEFTAKVPGTYSIIDHSIFRSFNKGAIAELKVTGKKNPKIFSGQLRNEADEPGV